MFHGLVELTLDWMEGPQLPNALHMYDILRANPALVTLRLASFSIDAPSDANVQKLELDKLKILSLKCLPWEFIRWLLRVIIPGFGLNPVLDFAFRDTCDARIGLNFPLAAPGRLKLLHLRNLRQRQLNVRRLLLFLPNLETLGLSDVKIKWIGVPVTDGSVQYPQLGVLHLFHCSTGDSHDFSVVL
ncbi:hypothetical protein RhiJN_05943 [Ceratobasidium sp. AG-Ba]|nr:hypothetical protein RhiJN_05943 [Ceratobasidium sp. AG-Ba]QRW06868.1 hypothetical protein RhiLY_05867 [Ceratobasidium sp. AG-Ba]